MGRKSKIEGVYMCTYSWITLLYSRNEHSTVKQIYFFFFFFLLMGRTFNLLLSLSHTLTTTLCLPAPWSELHLPGKEEREEEKSRAPTCLWLEQGLCSTPVEDSSGLRTRRMKVSEWEVIPACPPLTPMHLLCIYHIFIESFLKNYTLKNFKPIYNQKKS